MKNEKGNGLVYLKADATQPEVIFQAVYWVRMRTKLRVIVAMTKWTIKMVLIEIKRLYCVLCTWKW